MQRFTNLDALVPFAKLRSQRGFYDGRVNGQSATLIALCRHELVLDRERAMSVLFTRDIGHHTSGWWKNPDYERCWHLSLAMWERRFGRSLPHEAGEFQRVAEAFYGDDTRLVWIEGPYSPEGKAKDVWHYRLFADPSWAPLLPRGEVYSTDWTPPDWRSFSEVHGYKPSPDQAPFLLAASE